MYILVKGRWEMFFEMLDINSVLRKPRKGTIKVGITDQFDAPE